MKKSPLLFLLILSCAITTYSFGQTQAKSSVPVYLKDAVIPFFTIQKLDSTWFTKDSLPNKRPIVLIYFSPDCGHCQWEATEIVKNMDSLNKAFFVWISSLSLGKINTFYNTFGLNKFNNIAIGKDVKYFIPVYYSIKYDPFIVIYDKRGAYVKEFRDGVKIPDLIKALKLLY